MTARKVLVAGSRSYSDTDRITSRLDALRAECEAAGDTLTIVEGGNRGKRDTSGRAVAPGADRIAAEWAKRTPGVGHKEAPADWHGPCEPDCPPGHRKPARGRRDPLFGGRTYCPWAGFHRNQVMLDEHGPIDLVLAYVDRPLARSKGTADMVRRAIAAGIPYELHEPEPAVPMARLWGET